MTGRVAMSPRSLLFLALLMSPPMGSQGLAQTPSLSEARLDTKRAQATRAELLASLAQIDTILNSRGYSSRLRDAKRREAVLIRERLGEGDLQVGDQVAITVLNEVALTDTFLVAPGRVLVLPGFEDVPLRGVLRSELEGHLRTHIGRYLRDPQVRAQTNIRVTILGAVGKQGFYHVPADVLVSDAIMFAGGLAAAADPNDTVIRRGGQVLLSQDQVRDAITRGATLDQLNLRAGDEIVVDAKVTRGGGTLTWVTLSSVATTALYYFLFRSRR